MEPAETIPMTFAFMAGFLSFISPCVLPLVPSFLVFITGLSFDQLTQEEQNRAFRMRTLAHTTSFILGFSTIFILFGASATYFGKFLLTYQDWVRQIGGIIVIFFGLYLAGVIKVPFLMAEKRVHLAKKPAGYIGTFLVGNAFAAGWTPCVGPILGTILMVASTSESVYQGIMLLTFYSLGIGLPLFAVSLSLNAFLKRFKSLHPYLGKVSFVSGIFLILLGVMFFTNSFSTFTAFLTEHQIGWYLFQ